MRKQVATTLWGIPKPWFYLGLGLCLTPIFKLGFVFSYMGWFLEALMHEMGHCAAALFFGCFAFPAIRLDGHAAAFHHDQSVFIAMLVWAALGVMTWYCRSRKTLWIPLLALTLLYPLLAFTNAKEFCHLVSGHLGELVFAAIFFWRAMAGGFFQESERPLYAMIAWYLWIQNVFLCASLIYSPAAREWYLANGSFGMENDYIRMAAMLGWRLQGVAAWMFLVSFSVPLASIVAWWWQQDGE